MRKFLTTKSEYDEAIKIKQKELSALKKQRREFEKGNPYAGMTKEEATTFKILYGWACIELMQKDENLKKKLYKFLDENVKTAYKRKLLRLPELEKNTNDTPEEQEDKASMSLPSLPAPERIELVVKHPKKDAGQDKDAAKAAGAHWDSEKFVWYVEKGFNLRRVEPWLPEEWKTRLTASEAPQNAQEKKQEGSSPRGFLFDPDKKAEDLY